MKYLISIILLFSLHILPASAQNQHSFGERLFFGGNFGLMIGTYTDIEVSPHVGYYITPRLSAGVGITYKYYNYRDHYIIGYDPVARRWITERLETHIWGGRLFANYVIINDVNDWIPFLPNMRIFAHTEYEALSFEKKMFFPKYARDDKGRETFHSFLVGGGFRFPMGRRSSFNLTLLWKLNSDLNDIYGNGPIIRVGFNF